MNKSSFAYTRGSGIFVEAMAIVGNAFDGHTLEPQLEQVMELAGGKIKKVIVDKQGTYFVTGKFPTLMKY